MIIRKLQKQSLLQSQTQEMSSKSKLSFQKEIPHTSSGSTGSAYTPYVSFLPQLDPKTISNPTNHHPRQKDRESKQQSPTFAICPESTPKTSYQAMESQIDDHLASLIKRREPIPQTHIKFTHHTSKVKIHFQNPNFLESENKPGGESCPLD